MKYVSIYLIVNFKNINLFSIFVLLVKINNKFENILVTIMTSPMTSGYYFNRF